MQPPSIGRCARRTAQGVLGPQLIPFDAWHRHGRRDVGLVRGGRRSAWLREFNPIDLLLGASAIPHLGSAAARDG